MTTQVKNLHDVRALRDYVAELGVEIPIADSVESDGALAQPITIGGPHGTPAMTAPNRFAILPMEGWDCETDGNPTDLVRRRWSRFGSSGAGLVWGEATAVQLDGRANPNQLVIRHDTIDGIAELRGLLHPDQVAGLQLTHSGRWSRPITPAPRIGYRHPYLDDKVGATDEHLLSDEELDEIAAAYVAAAHLAAEAGFDFVDVKACHGYLLHELLTNPREDSRYGGDLDGRSNLLCTAIATIRRELPDLAVAVRLSIFDLVPHTRGEDGIGVPVADGAYPYAFGGDGTGVGIDLTETHQLLNKLTDLGVTMISATAGSPYYVPHVQRPAYFPPSDGYLPPEDPMIGVARLLAATAELTAQHPELTVVGSGYSYLQDWLGNVGEAVVATGGADMIGIGRMALAYPQMPADILAGRTLERRLVCRTFSDCTTAPRNGLVSGCFPLDEFYKQHEDRVVLTKVKRETRQRVKSAE
jgi:2,4-dienoyl-CoA reductase-like NADH-dependent reductase (Old Yellow Enzyme family)